MNATLSDSQQVMRSRLAGLRAEFSTSMRRYGGRESSARAGSTGRLKRVFRAKTWALLSLFASLCVAQCSLI